MEVCFNSKKESEKWLDQFDKILSELLSDYSCTTKLVHNSDLSVNVVSAANGGYDGINVKLYCYYPEQMQNLKSWEISVNSGLKDAATDFVEVSTLQHIVSAVMLAAHSITE